jgi:phosphate/sulfate permease
MDIFVIIVAILFVLAAIDLMVGVSNDAVNFLNSALGAKVAPRFVIMIIASIGILIGVTFSSGMMEVARKGIMFPGQFFMPELLFIFLGVMLTDVILLDAFNSLGLPTSTTVSIVFELLGASVAMSLIKIAEADQGIAALANYINAQQALIIIMGILLSVVIAFSVGALVQFVTRIIFTFDFERRLRQYGSLFGGFALTAILYFILIKGSKGASFMDAESKMWIATNRQLLILISFSFWTVFLFVWQRVSSYNILRIVILAGTLALAMAFAANDLVNFIGVPLAGFHAHLLANLESNPLETLMVALEGPVRTETYMLLIAGAIMVVTLWRSKKAKTVTETEINLGRQGEGQERFGSSFLARAIVNSIMQLNRGMRAMMPSALWEAVNKRFTEIQNNNKDKAAFDLLRASVNLTVASALISFATSLKLPLSTTYVTFMVAMGTALADRAWGRESAVYRVNGVLTVIAGWFTTALVAFVAAMLMTTIIYHTGMYGIVALIALAAFTIIRFSRLHKRKAAGLE